MSNRFQMPSTDAVDLTGRTILQVVPELETGGAEITTMEMAEAIVKAGGRALVASEGGALESRIEAAGGEIVHMPVASKNPVTLWRNVGHLAKLMHAENVDLIHGRSRAPCWSALFAAKRSQTPYVTTFHSTVHGTPRAKVLYNSSLVRGQVSIANSHFTAARIEAIYPWAKSRLRVIPRGCDERALAQDNFSSADRLAKRAEWDVDADAFVIICPARITHLKGQHVLIEALGQIDHTLKPKLVLVGSAQGRENYVSDLKNQAGLWGCCTDWFLQVLKPICHPPMRQLIWPLCRPSALNRLAAPLLKRRPRVCRSSALMRGAIAKPLSPKRRKRAARAGLRKWAMRQHWQHKSAPP